MVDYIGRTIQLDLPTSDGARARYACVCVKVDLSKPLLGRYAIKDRTCCVVYESLENIYFFCGMYGHKNYCCPSVSPSYCDITHGIEFDS
ncbi:hypothetical protein LINPERHAP1_LOCUS19050 [Linum perenne]